MDVDSGVDPAAIPKTHDDRCTCYLCKVLVPIYDEVPEATVPARLPANFEPLRPEPRRVRSRSRSRAHDRVPGKGVRAARAVQGTVWFGDILAELLEDSSVELQQDKLSQPKARPDLAATSSPTSAHLSLAHLSSTSSPRSVTASPEYKDGLCEPGASSSSASPSAKASSSAIPHGPGIPGAPMESLHLLDMLEKPPPEQPKLPATPVVVSPLGNARAPDPDSFPGSECTIDSQDTLREEAERLAILEMENEEIRCERLAEKLGLSVGQCAEETYLAARHHKALCVGTPVQWEDCTALDEKLCLRNQLDKRERAIISEAYAKAKNMIYIGGTQVPVGRFYGSHHPAYARREDDDRGDFDGHCKMWNTMVVWGARWGSAGPSTETDAILWAKHEMDCKDNQRVFNVAMDSRGLSGKPGVVNFLYVCYN